MNAVAQRMPEIADQIEGVDTYLKRNPDAAALAAWRNVRDYMLAQADQAAVYVVLGMTLGFAVGMAVAVVGGLYTP
jgi:ABC-type nitrate/sulfonate/bicarbonate transport system permease component